MALKTLSTSGITNGSPILPAQVTQSIDAFTGVEGYSVTFSGSFTFSGATTGSGYFQNSISSSRAVSSSAAISASYAVSSSQAISSSYAFKSTSASFADNANTSINSTNASYSSLINNNSQPDVVLSGSGGSFVSGNLGLLAGSVTLSSGISPTLTPIILSGKRFQTDFWVTATKASGSTTPSQPSLLYVGSSALGSFFIQDYAGPVTNDDVNFIVVYK